MTTFLKKLHKAIVISDWVLYNLAIKQFTLLSIFLILTIMIVAYVDCFINF